MDTVKFINEGLRKAREKMSWMRLPKPHLLPGVIKLGMQYWRESDLGVVKTDKDGGFLIMRKADIMNVRLQSLSGSPHYAAMGTAWSSVEESLDHEMLYTCKRAGAHLEDDTLTAA